ncbi:MAG: FKBP-type peptidyl-prolyl cis-trans isomerase 2 [Vicingaceae bacterium]|jgi:FKBP-type peptidyl-prolyl cis-trans isomerase 2
MKSTILFVALLVCGILQAQHSTLRFTDEAINLSQKSVLVVPFESKMYLSDINKSLAENNNLNSSQIIKRFTAAIDQSIYYAFEQKCKVSSFYGIEDTSVTQDLNYIYDNLQLEYELVSVTEDQTKAEKLKAKLKKKEDNSYQKGQVNNGEIVTTRDVRERYMKTIITDQHMLDSMHFKFDNDYFLFVNQLDIKNDYSDMIAVQQGIYNRIVQLHYTLYNKDGSILTTGISKTTFSNNQNDINKIISENFPILAYQIFEDLFPPEEENTGPKVNVKKPWK